MSRFPRLPAPLLLLAVAPFGLAACDDAEPLPTPDPIRSETVADLPADPAAGRDSLGQPIALNRFTFFSLRDGEVVLSYDDDSRADSNSTQWDLGFRGTEIIANGGDEGPGEGGLQIVSGAFEDVTEAPAEGYAAALPPGSGNGWYNYNPGTFTVTPIPGRVLVVRTADGRYARVRILSYYRGNPDVIDPFTDADRYYTFDYVFQPDGSRSFED
jgi:hypothetical protein